MSPEQEERRGEEARVVLENGIYKEAYVQIEANIVAQLAKQATTAEQAEDLRRLLIALRKVKVYIEQVAATGTMAAMEQERKLSFMERVSGRFVA